MRVLASTLIGFWLVGCAEDPNTLTISLNVGPGVNIIAPAEAGKLFVDGCVKTRPRFKSIEAALSGEPFEQSPTTGTYFHQTYNLSFNANAERCSMIFAGSNDTAEVVAQSATASVRAIRPNPLPPNIDYTSRPGPDGLRYYKMVLPGQN